MRAVSIVVLKVFAREFYSSHASLFLLVIWIAGGFMRSQDHIALATFFITNEVTVLIPMAVWLLYTFKVIQFNRETLRHDENEFVLQAAFLTRPQQHQSVLPTVVVQLAPVVLYGFFLAVTAFKYHRDNVLMMVVLSVMLATNWTLSTFLRSINRPDREHRGNILTRFFNRSFAKPFPLYFTEWILRRQFLATVGVKVFCMLMLWSVTFLYTTEAYDVRLLAMALVIMAGMQVQLIWEMHRFDNFHFSMLRQLPLSFSKRILLTAASWVLITLPETGLLLSLFPPSLPELKLPESLLFYWSMFVLVYGMLHLRGTKPEQLTFWTFLFSIVTIILVLFKIPLLILSGVYALAGMVIWKMYYYRFEYVQ